MGRAESHEFDVGNKCTAPQAIHCGNLPSVHCSYDDGSGPSSLRD